MWCFQHNGLLTLFRLTVAPNLSLRQRAGSAAAGFALVAHFEGFSSDIINQQEAERVCEVHDALMQHEGQLSVHLSECHVCRRNKIMSIDSVHGF